MIKSQIQNNRKRLVAILLALVAILITLAAMNVASRAEQEERALEDLKEMIHEQAAAFSYIIELQYAPLETISNGLGLNTNLTLDDQRALLRDFVKNNHIVELGYADLEGNTISCFGEDLGNVSHRKYFKEIVEEGNARSIEYLETTSFSEDPKIILAVPIKKNGELIGAIFIAKERDVFLNAFPDQGIGGAVGYVTDSEGNFIILNPEARKHFEGDNFFTALVGEKIVDTNKEEIIKKLKNKEAGSFTTMHEGNRAEMVAYDSLNNNDWTLFCMVDKDAIVSKILTSQDIYSEAIIRVLGISILFIIYILYITKKHTAALKEEQEHTRFQMERANSLFDEMKSVVYAFDLRTQEFDVSDAFENTFGFPLKKQLMDNPRETMRMKYEYSEFLEGIQTVAKTGKRMVVNGSIVDNELGTKWMKISMNPFFSADKKVVSIYGVMSDVTETVEQEIYLREMAEIDEHTMLPNKSSCERMLNEQNVLTQPTGCIMIDLNGLKAVNDSLGHIVGDEMIKDFADLLRANIREGDFAGRFGGDEFFVVLNNAHESSIKSFIRRLDNQVASLNDRDEEYSISYSAGYAYTDGTEGVEMKELLDKADLSMYEAKRKHKESLESESN